MLNATGYVMPTSENELAWASLQFAVSISCLLASLLKVKGRI